MQHFKTHTLFMFLGLFALGALFYSCGNQGSKSKKEQEALTKKKPSENLKIGNLIFEPSNLSEVTFLNGDMITEAKSQQEWEIAGKNKEAAWCYSSQKNQFGEKEIFYNYYALTDPRKIVDASKLMSKEMVEELIKSSSSKDQIKGLFKNAFSEERNYAGKYFDLKVVNWWVFDTIQTEDDRAIAVSWSPMEDRAYITKVSKGSGFLIRCLKK